MRIDQKSIQSGQSLHGPHEAATWNSQERVHNKDRAEEELKTTTTSLSLSHSDVTGARSSGLALLPG